MKIAIIPARGGSKRIPGKNIRLFHGQPIIAYSIIAAQASALFDAILVSTDSDEIAAVAQACGAAFHRRPSSLADDYAGTQAVMRDALLNCGVAYDLACCIYPTAPMMTPGDLQAGFRALTRTDWDPVYAFSVTTYDAEVQRAFGLSQNGAVITTPFTTEEMMKQRSQDLPTYYHDAGQWYWGRADSFVRDAPIYGPASIGVPIPRYRCQDINSLEDWRQAELMFEALKLGEAR
jgi:pseudaminic acid cytidylyltransferase